MTQRAKLGISAIAIAAAIGLPALVSWSRSAEAASNVPPAALVEPAKAIGRSPCSRAAVSGSRSGL